MSAADHTAALQSFLHRDIDAYIEYRGVPLAGLTPARASASRLPALSMKFHPYLCQLGSNSSSSMNGTLNSTGNSMNSSMNSSSTTQKLSDTAELKYCLVSCGTRHVRFWTLERRAKPAEVTAYFNCLN
jgi:hypothetical protein